MDVREMRKRFYESQEWRELRYRVLRKLGFKCQACGRRGGDTVLHVDHIKPRSKFPELSLDESNLQVLCEDCNLGKSDEFEDRHREAPALSEEDQEKKHRALMAIERFEDLATQAKLGPEQRKRVLEVLNNEVRAFELKERALKLVPYAEGKFATQALEAIMDLHRKRRTSGDDGGNGGAA